MHKDERVLVKHSVTGRMLAASADGVEYALERQGGQTVITLTGVSAEHGDEIVKLWPELNVFRFEEPPGGPVVKHWYYVGNHPVQYDAAAVRLTVTAESEIEYRPDRYWQ